MRAAQRRILRLLSKKRMSSFGAVCPELVFEILSPYEPLEFGLRKIGVYLKNGALCAVLIDPDQRIVEVSYADGRRETLNDPATVTIGLGSLPGASEPFVLELAELFAP